MSFFPWSKKDKKSKEKKAGSVAASSTPLASIPASSNDISKSYQSMIQDRWSHPAKIDLNKKLNPKQKTIQAFNIDA